jgi:hypothetical protein
MRTRKHHLILAVITTIASLHALAQVEPRLPEEPPPILIGIAHPELAGIKGLYLYIMMPEAEAKKYGSDWEELKVKVEKKLREPGIALIPQLYDGQQVRSPALRIDIDIHKLKDTQQYIFRIQTSLVRTVSLQAQPNFHFNADVWKNTSSMQPVSVQTMPAVVTSVVLAQVDEFIADYRLANQPGKHVADANDIAAVLPVVTGKKTKPPSKPTTAEYKYVASKNSKVFHKPDCRWAKRIKPTNLLTFGTRGMAIEAGKRPCKQCEP